MKQILLGWLAAKGIVLANDSSDQAVVAAVQKVAAKNDEQSNALANEKDSFETKSVALANELSASKTALANEQAAHKSARKQAAELAADLAIQRGSKNVADRAATVTALENSADFAKDSAALLAAKPIRKMDAIGGKQNSALENEAEQTAAEYNAALQAELIVTGQNVIKAHANVMKLPKYAGLATKITPKAQ
jgi:hypothetical protein